MGGGILRLITVKNGVISRENKKYTLLCLHIHGIFFLSREKVTHIQKARCNLLLQKYTRNREWNQITAAFIDKHISHLMQKRFWECGTWLEFYANREVDKVKVSRANFCKNRFCPMCAWRQAKKDALKIGVMMDYIEAEHKKAFIFVTFTAPNVKADELKQEITRYNQAFKNLVKRDIVARMNHGYIRKLEVTYNEKRKDYHAHFHCVFALNASYFTDRTYIKQEKWLELWRDVMKDERITQVDVRRVKKSESGKDISEIAKYAAKDSDYTHSQDVFDSFYNALKGRQVLTYNGLFATANKKFKAHELDDYISPDNTEYCYILLYRWGKGEYIEHERRELTSEEMETINMRLMDETDIED